MLGIYSVCFSSLSNRPEENNVYVVLRKSLNYTDRQKGPKNSYNPPKKMIQISCQICPKLEDCSRQTHKKLNIDSSHLFIMGISAPQPATL